MDQDPQLVVGLLVVVVLVEILEDLMQPWVVQVVVEMGDILATVAQEFMQQAVVLVEEVILLVVMVVPES